LKFSTRAIWIMAWTMALSPLVGKQVGDERSIDLDLVDFETLQVGQAGITGAEVVDGQLDTLGFPVRHHPQHPLLALEQDGFGQFQIQALGREPALRQGLADLLTQAREAELDGGQVNRHHQVRAARGAPGGGLATGLPQDPAAEGDDEPALLGHVDEVAGRHQPDTRPPPADQCLGAQDPAAVRW
jgi:hypothetical protein